MVADGVTKNRCLSKHICGRKIFFGRLMASLSFPISASFLFLYVVLPQRDLLLNMQHAYVRTLIYALPCWTKSFFKTTLRKKSLGPEKKKSFIPSPESGTWPANLEGQKFRPTLSTAHSPLSTWFTYWPQKRKGTFLPFCSDISGSALEIKNFSLHRPILASFPLI